MIWRLVLEQVATLAEIETQWSLDDVYRANAMLDMRAAVSEAIDVETKNRNKAERSRGR